MSSTFFFRHLTVATRLSAGLAIALVGTTAHADPPQAPIAPKPVLMSTAVNMYGTPAEVKFEASPPNADFHLEIGRTMVTSGKTTRRAGVYQDICRAPCSAILPTGNHTIAMGQPGGPEVEPPTPLNISGPGTVHGTLTSHADLRNAGTAVVVAGVATGAGILFAGVAGAGGSQDCSAGTCFGPNFTVMAVGGVIGLASLVAGIALELQRDETSITFVPGAPSAPVAPASMSGAPAPRDTGFDPRGASLVVRF